MFDFVRKHTKVLMFVMFLLIIPSFVLFGIDGYNRMSERGEAVARVGGKDISRSEWEAAHKAQIDRMRESMPAIDLKVLDSATARYAVLERLVRERVIAQTAESQRLTTSDARLARELQQDPTIGSMKKADGSLDMDKYRQLAAAQGLTPEGFEARIRNDLSVRQVEAGLLSSSFASGVIADQSLNAYFEKREVQVAKFAPEDFSSKVNLSEQDLEAYYKDNISKFQAPESADIEYVVLDLDAVKKTIAISESDLKTYYEQNLARLTGSEERRASHILITAAKDAPADARSKARQRAEELLADVRKSPSSFAAVASKNSQDPGSAKAGGDLDYFGHGAMVKPFEDAVFSMNKGDISNVVETDFGFHIIKLTDIKAPKQKSFEESRATIEADLRAQQAAGKFAEAAEAFTNGVYEQSDSLKPVADRLKLIVKTANGVVRAGNVNQSGPLANPKFLSALFAGDSLDKKHNTEAVEVGQNQLASGRILRYQPAQAKPFAEVKDLVRKSLQDERASQLAKKEGKEMLDVWKRTPESAKLASAVMVSRDQKNELPIQVLNGVMRAKLASMPVWLGVDLGVQGYAIAKINAVLPRNSPGDNEAKQGRQQYGQQWARAEAQAYYDVLKSSLKAQILVPRPSVLDGLSGLETQK